MDRFELKTSEDLQQIRDTRIDGRISENTLKNTNWALATWNKWAEWRNKAQTDEMPEVPMGEELADLSDESLSTFLSLYVCEVKRENGTYYTPDTLYNLVCGLNRYLKLKKGQPDINFFEDRGPFAEFKKTMDGQIINLSRQDSCTLNRRTTENVTEEQEAILWDKSIFTLTTAQGLSYAAFHYMCKDFGLKGRDRHRELRVDNFAFGEDRVGKFVEFVGSTAETSSTPTSKFGLINKSRGKSFRKPRNTKCYEEKMNPISLYTILETYLAHVPPQGCFYRKPLPPSAFEQIRFADVPIGKNTLGEYTKTFMGQAGFEGNYTSQTSDGSSNKEPSVLAKKMLEILQDDDRELMQFSYIDSPSADYDDPESSMGEVIKIKQEVMDSDCDDGANNYEAEASDNEDNIGNADTTRNSDASPIQPLPIGIGQPFSIAPESDRFSTTLPISRTSIYRKIESKDKLNSNSPSIGKPILLSPISTTLTSSSQKGLVNSEIINRKRKLDAVYADIQMNQPPTVLPPAIGIPVTLFQAGTSSTVPQTIISNIHSHTNGIQKDYRQKSTTELSNSAIDKELKELKRQKYTLEIEHFKRLASSEKESSEMKKLEKVKLSLEIDKLRLEKEKLELEVNRMRCDQASNL